MIQGILKYESWNSVVSVKLHTGSNGYDHHNVRNSERPRYTQLQVPRHMYWEDPRAYLHGVKIRKAWEAKKITWRDQKGSRRIKRPFFYG